MAGRARKNLHRRRRTRGRRALRTSWKGYSQSISVLIEKLNTAPIKTAAAQVPPVSQSTQPPLATEQKEFGEVLHSLPNGVSGADQMLVAASHAQAASGDNTFSTNEANSLLLEQGVKLSNRPSRLRTQLPRNVCSRLASGIASPRLERAI